MLEPAVVKRPSTKRLLGPDSLIPRSTGRLDSLSFDLPTDRPDDSNRTLFVGDLSYFCTEEDLCRLFRPYGPILTVRVRRGNNGDSLMHGFVALETAEMTRLAIAQLDGQDFMGRHIRVQLSVDGHVSSDSLQPSVKQFAVQMHVSFISQQLQLLVTERVLRDLFGAFGPVADVAVKKHNIQQKPMRQSGYGFVYYRRAES
eukprot:gene33931-41064_t